MDWFYRKRRARATDRKLAEIREPADKQFNAAMKEMDKAQALIEEAKSDMTVRLYLAVNRRPHS